ncbi:hypothetical protein ACFXKY_15800 [Streptomyces canus]|uniref:hypothetical protein n=1 Tax=Streptomyces canus TaxID=58343 RepID=UPI0036CEE91D
MAHVFLSGVLGAAVLAVVLIYRSQQRLAARLAKIEAEVAADKIARLTQQLVPPALPAEEEEPAEPARRKRHLALYLGGGVAAILVSFGERLRSSWRRSPAFTATGTVAVVAVASTAAALCLPSNDTPPEIRNPPQPATTSQPPRAGASASGHSAEPGPSDDGETGANDSRYQATEIGTYRALTSGAGEPPERSVYDGTKAAPGNAGHSSKPTTSAPSSQPSPGDSEASPGHPGPGDPSHPGPVTPGALTVGKVERAATEKRWCEDVTVEFHNGGGSPVKSGLVTFGTHILDVLGGDWKTITQTRELSTPVPAGATVDRTWTLCVDSWRVPSGWHLDTLDVAVALN